MPGVRINGSREKSTTISCGKFSIVPPPKSLSLENTEMRSNREPAAESSKGPQMNHQVN